MKNTTLKRAIKVNVNAGKLAGTSYVIGGEKSGRFYSAGSTNNRIKSLKNTKTRISFMDILKAIYILLLIGVAILAVQNV